MATAHWLNRTGVAPLFAAMFGVAAATLVAAMLPHTFTAFTAAVGLGPSRPLAMLVALVAVALPVWIATALVERGYDRRRAAPVAAADDDLLDLTPFAEPEPRGPIFADRELGAPLMSDEALRSLAPPPPPEPPEVVEDDAPGTATPITATVEPKVIEGDADDIPAATGVSLFEPLEVEEFDLPPAPDDDHPRAGETSIDALIRRLEEGLARREPPAAGDTPPHVAAVLRSEIARAAPPAASKSGKPDDATARALQTLRAMATS